MFHWRACLLIVISGGAWSQAPIPSQTATQVTTRRTAIQVTFGEPNVWSLDQAHYLLEQRFQKNQTLEATRPGADELNASAINGNRLSALRQLVQAGAGYDQATGLTNQFAQQRMQEDLAIRPERRRQLDGSLIRQSDLAKQIQDIADNPASYQPVATNPTAKEFTAEAKQRTAALTAQLDAEKRAGDVYKSALTDSVPTTLSKSDLAPNRVSLSGSTLDVFKDKFAFGDPKLAASNAVDNFVNLQNEMIMKQVTLLRNEAGLNRRIMFAELPQAFAVDGSRWYAKRAENKVVRVEWKLKGFLYVPVHVRRTMTDQLAKGFLRRWLVDACAAGYCNRKGDGAKLKEEIERLAKAYKDDTDAKEALEWLAKHAVYASIQDSNTQSKAPVANSTTMPAGTLRTVDLVPRQSSLNINDRHYASSSWNFAFLFRLLSGVGGNFDYQRQKETYEQYLTQETFATSFGKGSNEFGWTFGPNPGTKTVAPGQRTTYAIFSVPANALAVTLTAKYCVRDRRDIDEAADCTKEIEFPLPVPGEFESGFWVDEVRYQPTTAGQRTTVHLRGRHFSTLTGVAVNGVALRRVIGLAAPYMAASGLLGGSLEPEGEYEMLTPDQIAIAFRMPPGFIGTPTISLLTPVKARMINDLPVRVRIGEQQLIGPLWNPDLIPMFLPKPEVKAIRWQQGSKSITIEGSGFIRESWVRYYWNGTLTSWKPSGTSRDVYTDRLELPVDPVQSPDQICELRMEFDKGLGVSPQRFLVANPGALSISKTSALKFSAYKPKVKANPAKKIEEADAVPGVALLEIQGSGFDSQTTASIKLSHGTPKNQALRLVHDSRMLIHMDLEEETKNASYALITIRRGQLETSAFVELPATPAKAEEKDEIAETTIKRVPIKKAEPTKTTPEPKP